MTYDAEPAFKRVGEQEQDQAPAPIVTPRGG
jgi:hypothetical protein